MSFCCGTNLKTGSSKNVRREKGIFLVSRFQGKESIVVAKNVSQVLTVFCCAKRRFKESDKCFHSRTHFGLRRRRNFLTFSELDDAWICCNAITML